MDVQCDQLVTVVSRTRLTTHMRCPCDRWRAAAKFVLNSRIWDSKWKYHYFWRYPNFLKIGPQCRICLAVPTSISIYADGTRATVPTPCRPSCCTQSCTQSSINSPQSSSVVDRTCHARLPSTRRRQVLSIPDHPLSLFICTRRRSVCRCEIFYVHSLGPSCRGKYSYNAL